MQISDEVIRILEYLCDKIGIICVLYVERNFTLQINLKEAKL